MKQKPRIRLDRCTGLWRVDNPLTLRPSGQRTMRAPLIPGKRVSVAPWNWSLWDKANDFCAQRNLEEGRYLP